jgi:UDP-3-O-acyl-N-acetylglucosamine deacetylase
MLELPIMDGSSKYFVEALEKLKSKSKMPKEIFMW